MIKYKKTLLWVSWITCFVTGLLAMPAGAEPGLDDLRADYRAALVIDNATGEVLYEDNAHDRHDPASLVKMMVVLVTLERVEAGKLRLDARVKVSAAASRIGGHQVYLKEGEVFSLRELLEAVTVASANDAAFAVAEHAAGSADAFVALMNERAAALGMADTRFSNPHGLPPDRRRNQQANYSSAHDLAILAKTLMRHDLARKWAATQTLRFRDGQMLLVNTNRRFLRGFAGGDGFKTGYHPRGAGFCLVATAARDGRRLTAVVLGAPSAKDRLAVTSRLLDGGFSGELQLAKIRQPVVVGSAESALVPNHAAD